MKRAGLCSLILLFTFAGFIGCSKQIVEPNFTGSIEGQVLSSKTGEGVSFVSVSTNPGTNAILTDSSGHFAFHDIPTGTYTINVRKDGFKTALVHVNVEKNETATAKILLKKGDDKPTGTFIEAHVTNSFFHTSNDSSFVDVNFRVENTSSNKRVPSYEVYFKIYAPKKTFYAQAVRDCTLSAGQQFIGSFTKYLHQAKSVDSVVVSDVYAPTGP